MTTIDPTDPFYDEPTGDPMSQEMGLELTLNLIDEILARLHPRVAEGLLLAAIPFSYDVPLLAALRGSRDGKDEKMFERLFEFSFITLDTDGRSCRVDSLHRQVLQEKFIREEKAGYLAAQERLLAYLATHPADELVLHNQNLLYHGLLAEPHKEAAGQVRSLATMVRLFRAYEAERQLAAIDRLLTTGEQARPNLVHLETPWLDAFDDLCLYLRARYRQLRGAWSESLEVLQELSGKPGLWPALLPYVFRAFGDALANQDDFVGAIAQYKKALAGLTRQVRERNQEESRHALEAERGATMIALGDAHAGLAIYARGQQEILRDRRLWAQARDWLSTALALPMVLYLWLYLGWRVWHPRFWIALSGEDWLIARLFALSAYWYRQADPLLERYGTRPEAVAADERLAYLFLQLGDAAQAARRFDELRQEQEAPLGEYRRASVELGLAEARFSLGRRQEALVLLETTLPVLERLEDAALVARGQTLLAETRLAGGDVPGALAVFERAVRGYQALRSQVAATEIVERLERWAGAGAGGSADAAVDSIEPITALLSRRHYPVRFVHPLLGWLRAFLLLSLAAALMFVPLMVLRFEAAAGLAPAIAFRPAPLLDLDAPFMANLSRGLQAARAAEAQLATTADSLLFLAAWIALAYIILTLLIGLALILWTPLSTVQKLSAGSLVRLTPEELIVGAGKSAPRVRLDGIREVILSDVRFWPGEPMSGSVLVVSDENERVKVRGTTRRYRSLRRRIEARLPAGVAVDRRDYIAWSSPWLWLFIAGLLVIWPLMLLTRFSADFVWQNLFGIYSIAELYPYLYLLLFLPVCWWAIGRPTWQLVETAPTAAWPWVLSGGGVVLYLWQIATRFRDLLTVPDIYPPLLTLFLFVGAVWFIARAGRKNPAVASRWQKALLFLAALSVGAAMLGRLGRDIAAYHQLVAGRYWNEQAVERQNRGAAADELFALALERYDRASRIMETPLLGIRGAQAARRRLGVPRTEDHIWLQALQDRALVNARLGNFEEAIAGLEQLLQFAEEPAQVYAWLAVVYQSIRPDDHPELVFAVETENYLVALELYDRALSVEPGRAEFALWRGVTYHALGRLQAAEQDYKEALRVTARGGRPLTRRGRAQALTGWGWILWTEDDIDGALERFKEAAAADRTLSEAYLGIGYASYRLRDYAAAEQALLQAAELAPNDPLPLIALGTVNWRLGGLAHDPASGGQEVCGLSGATPEEKLTAQSHWEQSANYFTRAATLALQNPEDIAYTYRTRGQIQYLLRDCPAYDKNAQYQAAVDSYSQALVHDPDEARYWQLRARLRYALWLRTGLDRYLFDGWWDIEQALALDPEDGTSRTYRGTFTAEILNYLGPEGWQAYRAAVESGTLDGRKPTDFGCAYNTRFVADVTIPDDTAIDPGATFEKIWRIRNVGACPWREGTVWAFVAGDRLGAPAFVPLLAARFRDEVEVAVTFRAPRTPGTYRSDWALRPPDGVPLAKRYYVQIVVPARP